MAEADWLQELRRQCQATSQAKVAERLGLSPATVSLVLRGVYSGSVENVEARVRGVFMGGVVDCPVLGEISTHVCQGHQRRRFAATSPERVALYRECRRPCPHANPTRESEP